MVRGAKMSLTAWPIKHHSVWNYWVSTVKPRRESASIKKRTPPPWHPSSPRLSPDPESLSQNSFSVCHLIGKAKEMTGHHKCQKKCTIKMHLPFVENLGLQMASPKQVWIPPGFVGIWISQPRGQDLLNEFSGKGSITLPPNLGNRNGPQCTN